MRCNKCGYENPAGHTTCVSCGSPLQQMGGQGYAPYNNGVQSPYQDSETKQTRVFNGVPGGPAQQYSTPHQPQPTVVQGAMSRELKSTVVQGAVSAEARSTVVQGAPRAESNKCPDCNYELKDDYDYCPRCGKVLRAKPTANSQQPTASSLRSIELEPNICDKCGEQVPAEYQYCPRCGERIIQKTIPVTRRRQVVEQPKPRCLITMIVDDDEKQEALEHEFEGAEVMLNRDNTEPLNRTITTKEQARLTFEDGKWSIENRSELDSTFVAASRKVELQSGDIIMMGDRCFRFETLAEKTED